MRILSSRSESVLRLLNVRVVLPFECHVVVENLQLLSIKCERLLIVLSTFEQLYGQCILILPPIFLDYRILNFVSNNSGVHEFFPL